MKLFKGDDPFFCKDEDGRDIFYPWGYPGEGFYVNQRQYKQLRFVFWLVWGAFVSAVCIAGYTYDAENFYSGVWVWGASMTVAIFIYVVLMGGIINLARLNPSSEEGGIPSAVKTLFYLFLVQSLILLMGVYLDPAYIWFKLVLATTAVLYAVLGVLSIKRYIVSKVRLGK